MTPLLSLEIRLIITSLAFSLHFVLLNCFLKLGLFTSAMLLLFKRNIPAKWASLSTMHNLSTLNKFRQKLRGCRYSFSQNLSAFVI